jgi:hypothetical protein
MALSKASALLAAALIVAPAWNARAQSTTESSVPQAQTQAAPATQAQSQPGQAQTAPPKPGRESRRKKRTPRESSRQPAAPTPGSFDENRAPRLAGPTRQEMTLLTNVLGGYDDNLTAGVGTGSGIAPTAMASGYNASLDATLGYFRGNARRSLRVDSTGNLFAYPGYLEGVSAGGAATVGVSTAVGRDQTVRISERVGYEPYFNVYSPGASATPLPPGVGESVPATGLFERRSASSNSSVSVDSRWSLRNWTTLSASYGAQRFTDDDYGDSTTWSLQAEYRRGLARGVRARASYQYIDTEYTASDKATLPTRQHRIEGGPEVDKALSRRRHLTMSLAAGATRLESIDSMSLVPYHAWVPVGSAKATLGFSSRWSLDGEYRRDFSLLRGVTDNVYTTDTFSVSTGGFVAPRTTLRVGANYGNWKTPLASGVDETMNVYGASLQVHVAVTTKVAATADYYYYHHVYSNAGDLPAGFPADYNRQAVRVGVTVWLPLAGDPRSPLAQR